MCHHSTKQNHKQKFNAQSQKREEMTFDILYLCIECHMVFAFGNILKIQFDVKKKIQIPITQVLILHLSYFN